jgi:hypothetical protein
MGTLAAIKAQLQTVLQFVPEAGIVHTYERETLTQAQLKAVFTDPDTGKIRAWTISREATPSSNQDLREYRTHRMILRLYLGLKDADNTEADFDALVEAAAAALRAQRAGNLNATVDQLGPIQVRVTEPRMLPAGVLVHYAEIAVSASVLSEGSGQRAANTEGGKR